MHVSVSVLVDIWSVGCIMAELLTSKTLFPGNDHILHINCHNQHTVQEFHSGVSFPFSVGGHLVLF